MIIVGQVDLLLIVSDPTQKGVLTAKRINSLVDELKLDVDTRKLIVNRVSDENFEKLKDANTDLSIKDIYHVPQDDNIFNLDLEGKPVFELPHDSAAVKRVFDILDECNIP